MKVRIISPSGWGNPDRHGKHYKQGEIADLEPSVAEKLFRHRLAEPIREKKVERATRAPRENTKKTLTTKDI